jgi:Immunity protein 52
MGKRETEGMMPRYKINAFWGPRVETPEALAVRFNRLIDRLAPVDPVFGDWMWVGRESETIVFPTIRNQLVEYIAEEVARNDFDEPVPEFGYWLSVVNSLEPTSRSISMRIKSGCQVNGPYYSNHAIIETAWRVVPDPAIVTFPIFKAVLLALSESFDVTFCNAYPSDLTDLWPKDQKFHFGWMNNISPHFAPLITPPSSAIVEYRRDGALFMAATDETFITANPRHVAVARDIEAAIAPLNALPWPPDAETE